MSPARRLPATWVLSLLAGLATWVTLLAWSGFAEQPSSYLLPLLGVVAAVAVMGMLLRTLRVPALVVALVQLLVLLMWLQQQLASAYAIGGIVPTPSSLRHLASIVSDASLSAQQYAAPIPASVTRFFPLMVVAGSATAVLVDLLAVGLRRAPLAGLPLLAAYTAPVSILHGGVSWLTFAAAALCFLFLVAADEGGRMLAWGRHLTPTRGLFDPVSPTVGTGGLWSSARRIGFTATALAVVVPVLVPTFGGALFGGGDNGGGSGDGVSIANPMVDLRRDLSQGVDVPLLTVRTADPDPSYLRISVLDSFDGSAWRPSGRTIPSKQRADGTVARPPGLDTAVRSTAYTSSIEVGSNFASRWLPTPYPVTSVNAPGDWRYDTSTMDFLSAADGETTAGLSYRLRALVLTPTARQLASFVSAPTSVSQPNTDLPRNFPQAVRSLAKAVAGDRPTRFEQAVALQEWFRVGGGFHYSLRQSPGNGTDDLVRFLSTGRGGRVGYCEQFAAAMAAMGRALGIPSRVAVGFLRPELTHADTWVYSSHDLHAWPEMFFGGIGWVRFEPTPQGRTGDAPTYTTQAVPQAPTIRPSASAEVSAPTAARRTEAPTRTATGTTTTGPSSGADPLWLLLVPGLLLLAVLLAAPRSARTLVRRRRWSRATSPAGWAEAGWAELRDSAHDLAVPWDDSVTLRTTATALGRHLAGPTTPADARLRRPPRGPDAAPEATAALHRVVGLLERARYARSLEDSSISREQVAGEVSLVVTAMTAGVGRRRVRRARWLPASVLPRRSGGGTRSGRRGTRTVEPGLDRAV